MQCPACGANSPKEARVCAECGQTLSHVMVTRAVPEASSDREDAGAHDLGWVPPEASTLDTPQVAERSPGVPREFLRDERLISGIARAVVQRQEARSTGSTTQVWTFRMERHDGNGNPLPSVPVEMRAASFEGSVSEGDWVEVHGQWREGQTIRPKRVRVLATGAVVKRRGFQPGTPLGVLAILTILSVCALVAFTALHEFDAFGRISGYRTCEPISGKATCTNLFGPIDHTLVDCASWPPLIGQEICGLLDRRARG